MKPKADRQREALLAQVLSLSRSCPFHRCNPPDCPLYEVRKLKRAERVKWLSALAESDLSYLIAYHSICLATGPEQPRQVPAGETAPAEA